MKLSVVGSMGSHLYITSATVSAGFGRLTAVDHFAMGKNKTSIQITQKGELRSMARWLGSKIKEGSGGQKEDRLQLIRRQHSR